MEPRNRFQGINSAGLCSPAGRYDNPIPTRFLAPIDFIKIPGQYRYLPAKTPGSRERERLAECSTGPSGQQSPKFRSLGLS
jgi:hypothetical protein